MNQNIENREYKKLTSSITGSKLYNLYSGKLHELLSHELLKVLRYYQGVSVTDFSEEDYTLLNQFLDNFLTLFCKEDFMIPEKHQENFIFDNALISDLVFLSDLKTTDTYLENIDKMCRENPVRNNIVKLLTLFSIRNTYNFDYEFYFEKDPEAVSYWYWQFFRSTIFLNEKNCQIIENHIDKVFLNDERAVIPHTINFPYFHATYAHHLKDKTVKRRINELIKQRTSNLKIANKPDRKKILIASKAFYPRHSVYRGTAEFIKALAKDYELTLLILGEHGYDVDHNIFKEVKKIHLKNDGINVAELDNNNYIMVIYPDIGISFESIFLANIRIAPIQVTCHGHSVSTFGADIDYFISGQDCELPEKYKENYSERLVLIPGKGLQSEYPSYQHRNNLKTTERFLISCPWSYVKINYRILSLLKKILAQAGKELLFRFFPACSQGTKYLAIKKEIEDILGKQNVEVLEFVSDRYMPLLEESDLILDPFPFGGYNTVLDALYLKKPVVTLPGTKAYNRFAQSLLKRAGLPELISEDEDDYIDLTLKLINDKIFFEQVINKIRNCDLKTAVFNTDEQHYFKKAVDYLINNHYELQSEKTSMPIFIN